MFRTSASIRIEHDIGVIRKDRIFVGGMGNVAGSLYTAREILRFA